MFSPIIKLTIFLLFLSLSSSQDVPISFTSSHSPYAFLFKAIIRPQAHFRLYSKKFRSSGDYWTTISTHGDKTKFQPKTSNEILFNDKHQGQYHIALYGQNDGTGSIHEKRHFHYAKVQVENGKTYGFLLPLFTQDVPALRTDRLFRCSNTLISIEWKDGSAIISAFSKTDKWRILQSIDDGFMNDQRGIQYGRAIDHGHTHGVIIELNDREFCVISQQSQPAPPIELNQKRQFYDVTTILDLVGASQPIRKRNPQEPHPQQL